MKIRKIATCPACKGTIHLQENTKVNELVSYPNCSSLLEFISQHPPVLSWADDPLVIPSRRIMKQNY